MIKSYLGNDTWEICLTSGKELVLNKDELDELISNFDEGIEERADNLKCFNNELDDIMWQLKVSFNDFKSKNNRFP